jgi:hypothetical protein
MQPIERRHPRAGSPRATIAQHLTSRGVVLRRKPLTQLQIDEAVRLYESALSLARVGERLGADPTTVQLRIRERGVVTRDAHGRVR